MRAAGAEEVATRETSAASRRKVRPVKATRAVIAGAVRYAAKRKPLRMVEDVERLGAELDAHLFLNRKMLEQAHIEIRARRIVQNVAPGIAEGQTLSGCKGIGIV